MLWVASYGLMTGLAVTVLGSSVGSLVDRTNRLIAARGFILSQNTCVILATTSCFLLLSPSYTSDLSDTTEYKPFEQHDTYSLLLIAGIHILGSAAKILNEGFVVAIERDWVVVMSQHVQPATNSSIWLSKTNVAMKQIYLGCKITAPAVWGFLIALVDNRSEENTKGHHFHYAAVAVGAIHLLTMLVQYYGTAKIHHSLPNLANLKLDKNKTPDSCLDEEEPVPLTAMNNHPQTGFLPRSIQIYLEQGTALAGIGLAML